MLGTARHRSTLSVLGGQAVFAPLGWLPDPGLIDRELANASTSTRSGCAPNTSGTGSRRAGSGAAVEEAPGALLQGPAEIGPEATWPQGRSGEGAETPPGHPGSCGPGRHRRAHLGAAPRSRHEARCRRGREHFELLVGAAVLANNLLVIADRLRRNGHGAAPPLHRSTAPSSTVPSQRTCP